MKKIDRDLAESINKCIGMTADAIRAGHKKAALESLGHLGLFTLRVNEQFDLLFQECSKLKDTINAIEKQQLRYQRPSLN